MQVREIMMVSDMVAHPDQSLLEAAARMREVGCDLLPVADGDSVVGVLSATDVLEHEPSDERQARDVTVQDRMSTDVAFCYVRDTVAEAEALMDADGHDHLVVVDDEGFLAGIVTRGQVADALDRGARAGEASRTAPSKRHVHTPGRAIRNEAGEPTSYDVRPRVRRGD